MENKEELIENYELMIERIKTMGLLDGIRDKKNIVFATKKIVELCGYLYININDDNIQLYAIPILISIINNGMNSKYSPESLCNYLSKFLYMKDNDEVSMCKIVADNFSNKSFKEKGFKLS